MAASTQTTKQRLALSIIDFLDKSLTDGTLTSDDKESVEVAQQSISDLFKVDATDKAAVQAAVGKQSLADIYGTYEKLMGKTAAGPETNAAGEPSPSAAYPTDEQKKEAEAMKSKGNAAMAKKDYTAAIDFYSQALAIIPGNPIFLSNRAAAYSASKDHASAKADAEAAVATDPKYTKAWSRLGLANFALGDAKAAMEAYQKGIDYEGNGGSEAMKKGFETASKKVREEGGDVAAAAPRGGPAGGMPDLSALAGMLGGQGGGMPDLSQIMSNPMFASMAEKFMQDPSMMENLMQNPKIKEMASQFGLGGEGGANGGGMPDMSKLMSDPTIAEMAKNFMGGKPPGSA